MTDCIVKQYGCSCEPGTCNAEIRSPAPVYLPTLLDHLVAAAAIALIAGFFAFVSIPRAQSAWHQQTLANQENIATAKGAASWH